MRRRWPIRLLEFSPLIVLALILAVWFSVPAGMRTLAYESATFRITPEMRAAGFDESMLETDLELSALQRLRNLTDTTISVDNYSVIGPLQGMADGVTGRLMREPWRFYDAEGRIRPNAVAETDEAFESVRQFEERFDSRIAVFVVAPDPSPPIAFSAIDTTSVLTAAELSELESSGTIESLRKTVRGRKADPLPVDIEGLNGGSGEPHADRTIVYVPKVVGGHVYETYAVWPKRDDVGFVDYPELNDTTAIDAQANVTALKRMARHGRGAIFVIGPTDGSYVPLRIPDALEASSIVLAVQEGLSGRFSNGWGNLVRAPMTARDALDGSEWIGAVLSYSPVSVVEDPKTGRTGVKQGLAFVALYDSSPEIPLIWANLGKTPRRVIQVWLAANLLFIAGALAVAFLASLVASPLAFAYERRATADLEIERERERVRRQARERVVERLAELSEQVDAAARTASETAQREVRDVASDIESTVTELRAILGGLSQAEADRDE